MRYWQQANSELTVSRTNRVGEIVPIEEALYIGRIPTHFGHFIMEGLPRLCDIHEMKIPIVGYVTTGTLPPDKRPIPIDNVCGIIHMLSEEVYHHVEVSFDYQVKKLYVPDLPYYLSYSCAEPWRMRDCIETIVTKCRQQNGDIENLSEDLWLSRDDEMSEAKTPLMAINASNPFSDIKEQIASISIRSKLHGFVGSNSHASIFARQSCKSNFTSRGSWESDRNQAICDLVKSYNIYD